MLNLKSGPRPENRLAYKSNRSEAQRVLRLCANDHYIKLSKNIQIASDNGNIRKMYKGIKTVVVKKV